VIKNILFIIPPSGSISHYIPKEPGQKKIILTIPYGVLSIISYINAEKKYNIEILDCNKLILDNLEHDNIEDLLYDTIKTKVIDMKPECIGISSLFNTSFQYMSIAKQIKEYFPSCFIALGGGLATNMYKKLLEQFPEIDAICYGEGEIPFKKLIENFSEKDISSLSKAWITKKTLENNKLPQYDFVQNLDDIPIIDFDYIDFKKYNGRSSIDKHNLSKVELSIHTSRGCPFNCVFCTNGNLHGKSIRTMSVSRIIETLYHYKKKYGMTMLLIEDDHFLHNKENSLRILQFLTDENINTEFPNGLTVYKIDDDIAKALYTARVKLVTLAIESCSDYVLKNIINKPLSVSVIMRAINFLKKYNIKIHAFVVIGIPGETDKHREESLNILLTLNLDWVYVFIATPLVGSRLYEICETNNYFTEDDNFSNHIVTKGNIKSPGIDPEQIEKYLYYMHVMINCIGNYNIKLGNYHTVEEYFLRVIKSYPRESTAHYMLSNIYSCMNENEKKVYHYDKYLEHYEEYIGINKDDPLWIPLIKDFFKRNENVSNL